MSEGAEFGGIGGEGSGSDAEVPSQPGALPPAPASLREDQVTNAVAFLSHPKARGGPPRTCA